MSFAPEAFTVTGRRSRLSMTGGNYNEGAGYTTTKHHSEVLAEKTKRTVPRRKSAHGLQGYLEDVLDPSQNYAYDHHVRAQKGFYNGEDGLAHTMGAKGWEGGADMEGGDDSADRQQLTQSARQGQRGAKGGDGAKAFRRRPSLDDLFLTEQPAAVAEPGCPCYTVSGAGLAVLNGVYCDGGTRHGRRVFARRGPPDVEGRTAILWRGLESRVWYLSRSRELSERLPPDDVDCHESVETGAVSPTAVAWLLCDGGAAPAPTVRHGAAPAGAAAVGLPFPPPRPHARSAHASQASLSRHTAHRVEYHASGAHAHAHSQAADEAVRHSHAAVWLHWEPADGHGLPADKYQVG
jgi:hypothetical protein